MDNPTEGGLDDVKDELNVTHSDSDIGDDEEDSRDTALKIEENILKDDTKMDLDISFPDASSVNREPNNFHTNLALLQPAQNPTEKKKENKSKREMEEEEREKMQ